MASRNGDKATIQQVFELVRDLDQKRVEAAQDQDLKRVEMERRIISKIDTSVGGVAESLGKLTTCVEEHHKTLHLSKLMNDAKFWGYLVMAFVVVNVVIDVGHPWVVALIKAWTGVQVP
jgi:hypothetical protein